MNILELKKDIFIQRNNNKTSGWLFNVIVAFRDEENEERKKKNVNLKFYTMLNYPTNVKAIEKHIKIQIMRIIWH